MRRPTGYLGYGHETIGSDILSVLRVISMPREIFGEKLHARLSRVQPGDWYPIELFLELLDTLESKLGRVGLVQAGRQVFELSHAVQFKANASCAADLVNGIDGMYRAANRGQQIGGWKVLALGPGMARLEKTTPHHCLLEEGILLGALSALSLPATVRQSRCLRAGADSCLFELSSAETGPKWMGGHVPVGA